MKLDGECNLIGESIAFEMQGLVLITLLHQRHISKLSFIYSCQLLLFVSCVISIVPEPCSSSQSPLAAHQQPMR